MFNTKDLSFVSVTTGRRMTINGKSSPLAEGRKSSLKQKDAAPPAAILPPDGGWGWVVVFASFMIHVIVDGVTYTFGIFYVEFLKHYGESKGLTAWVASIMIGTTYCIGPVASGLTNKYGCRAVTIGGSILAAVGLMFSLIVPSVHSLFFTIGICTGAGFGLMYLPSIVSVTCYFEKKRAFATGIAVCGAGLGTFALAPLTEYLVEQYAWKGAMLIISGLVLNCTVFGALFRPLPTSPSSATSDTHITEKKPHQNGTLPNGFCFSNEESISVSKPLIANGNIRKNSYGRITNGYCTISVHDVSKGSRTSLTPSRNFRREDSTSGRNQVQFHIGYSNNPSQPLIENAENVYIERGGRDRHTDENDDGLSENLDVPSFARGKTSPSTSVISVDFLRRKLEGTAFSSFVYSSSSLAQTNKELSELDHLPHSVLMDRKDIFYSGSLLNIPKYRSNPNVCYASVPTVDKVSRIEKHTFWCCPREVCHALLEMTDFSLLKNPVFLIFGISNFLTSIGFNVPFIYTKARVSELGFAGGEDASVLLSIIGISNTVGRITLGYLSDRAFINRLWVYNVSLVINGLATAFSCYAGSYVSMAVYCATFGATAGAYVSLTSVILVDLLGLDKLTNAFGLLLVFQGVSCLLGPPITGWLYDVLGSYDPGFVVSGAMIAASGLILFLVPCVSKPPKDAVHSTQKPAEREVSLP